MYAGGHEVRQTAADRDTLHATGPEPSSGLCGSQVSSDSVPDITYVT